MFSLVLFCVVSWCVVSDAEEQKCLDLASNATAKNVKGTLECVRGLNARDCMDKIKVDSERGRAEDEQGCNMKHSGCIDDYHYLTCLL